ncbi:crosslink repair DNA glycosylase YcaQ family protein [uncultured Pseudokineococcus sp.]|uniref:winged helix-turn-helix domain-containing protein n=1 Tax=uncultured Pseudokineococcus sp. TaxID=1642928 RepID=UPI00260BC84B|nr:crosslink repair DNA glycosylase YcaQ family protein [uncultured Pseudokineococcus sp.]
MADGRAAGPGPARGREVLTAAQARRTALAAQGFADRRPPGAPTMRHVQRVLDRVGLLQLDSVNVVARSHRLPLFSRLGPYDDDLLRRAAERPPRRLVEYWAHEASLVPPATHRLLRWRMARAADEAWGRYRRILAERPRLLDEVLGAVREGGAMTAAQLTAHLHPGAPRSSAGSWMVPPTEAVLAGPARDVKAAAEQLFWSGELTAAGRTAQFERRYDLPERVLPPEVAGAPDPDEADAVRGLVEIAGRSLGVATEAHLRDYFRLRPDASRRAVDELVEDGVLAPVTVRGWARPALLHRDAAFPRRVAGRALLSPFDSLVFERSRTEALFGVRLRLEIYVPAARRVHGYYVLPFLLDGELVARVDLKADRADGVLRVQAAWPEPWAPAHAAEELAGELRSMAAWLGLDDVAVTGPGDLAPALLEALRAT